MLVYADGGQKGTLGGGCVEAEVRQRALRSLGSGRAEVHTFNLDDNYGWDDGLICGGRMTILAAPLDQAALKRHAQCRTYYHRYRQFVEQGSGCTEAVVMSNSENALPVGSRYLFDSAGQLAAQIADGSLPELVRQNLVPLRQRPKPRVFQGVAYLPILPRITLLIVGGGHVGQAVAKLAAEVDFNIWVIDDRERYASRERFPSADRLMVGDIGATLKQLSTNDISPSTYCIIVTRGHAHDEEALFHLAPTSASYVGMIGSRRKKRLIYEDLRAKGISDATLAKVHSPLGLEIGSQTVPEIAISIVAELIACRNLSGQETKATQTVEKNDCAEGCTGAT